MDNDCNGVADDGKLDSGESCKCEPGQVRQCSQDSGGKAIVWPSGAPTGECKYGKQTCDDAGKWGACTGAVPPADEICDGLDNDCDGQTDEDDALNKKKWYWDADGDLHGDKTFAAVVACNAPSTPPQGCVESETTSCTVGPESWKNTILQDDCNDKDATTNPEAKEVCDGADNDCDGQVDEGATNIVTWYRDDDGDGFLLDSKKGQPLSLKQCTPPGNKPEECPEGKTPCSNLWLKEGTAAFTDCNDLNADVFPGAWDGPAFQPRPYGIVAPGLKVEFFKIPAVPAIPDFASLQPESATRTDVTINYNFGQGSIGEGLPVDIGARWTGSIVVPEDGEYTFSPESDDGVRLWVGDLQVPVVDDWTSHYPVEHTAKMQLLKGTYPLKLDWFDHHLGGSIILRWEGPGISKQPMTVVLEPTAAQQINRCGDGLDNNCDGQIDNGVIQTKGNGSVLAVGCNAECTPVDPDPTKNVTRLCGNSPEGVGICHKGSQYCRPDGTWSACAGEQTKLVEQCGNGLDDDCNGQQDETCACTQDQACTTSLGCTGTNKCVNFQPQGCAANGLCECGANGETGGSCAANGCPTGGTKVCNNHAFACQPIPGLCNPGTQIGCTIYGAFGGNQTCQPSCSYSACQLNNTVSWGWAAASGDVYHYCGYDSGSGHWFIPGSICGPDQDHAAALTPGRRLLPGTYTIYVGGWVTASQQAGVNGAQIDYCDGTGFCGSAYISKGTAIGLYWEVSVGYADNFQFGVWKSPAIPKASFEIHELTITCTGGQCLAGSLY